MLMILFLTFNKIKDKIVFMFTLWCEEQRAKYVTDSRG